ncbi:MAG TPA: phosphatidylserine/phosphatidylglycerophosphate/cardiolipin synthase family protein [Vicinamibacterales bacterium]|nr:phosphatidylserine/phosphatidylglycerophosphate/cardiolipin synthase family protein [Vicinamibacterales bacterium]
MARKRWLRGWKFGVLIALVIIGVLLYIVQDQEDLKVQSPVAATDPRFPDYIASLVGAPVEPGDHYVVLRNGDQAFPPMLDAVRKAKQRINLETFMYGDGIIGDEFTREFASAAQRGVTVRIVLDAMGGELSSETEKTLTNAGVKLVHFNPMRPWSLEETNYRTHRKSMIVDGDLAFTGGMGISDHWIGNAQSPDNWRDTHFQVTGPAVRALEASFYENWIESGGGAAPALDPEKPNQGTGARSVVVWSNPTAGASNVKLFYLLSIASARSTIDVQSPYVVLDNSTQGALDEARKRGVRVRILTDGEITDAKPVKHASRYLYQTLLESGYEIYEYEPTMMHVKALTVDGVWSIIGSANFDNRSFELNDELIVGISDPELATALVRDFEHDMTKATKLDAATWGNRSMWKKVQEKFWSLFSELF